MGSKTAEENDSDLPVKDCTSWTPVAIWTWAKVRSFVFLVKKDLIEDAQPRLEKHSGLSIHQARLVNLEIFPDKLGVFEYWFNNEVWQDAISIKYLHIK